MRHSYFRLCLAFWLIAQLSIFAGGQLAGISLHDIYVDIDQSFTMQVEMTTENLHQYSAVFDFDPTMLQVEAVKNSDFFSLGGVDQTTWETPKLDNSTGEIQIASTRQTATGITGSGNLVQLVFRTIKAGETKIEVKNATAFNPKGESLISADSEGDTAQITIYPPHGEVTGTVTYADGTPVEWATIEAYDSEGNLVGIGGSSDENGVYLIDVIAKPGFYDIFAYDYGFIPQLKSNLKVDIDQQSIANFELHPPTSLHSVVDENGFIRNWLVLGIIPWENDTTRVMTDQLNPNADPDSRFPVQETEEKVINPQDGDFGTGLASNMRWKLHVDNDAFIDFNNNIFNNNPNKGVGYAFTRIKSHQDQEVTLQIGHDNSLLAWVNGKLIHMNNESKGWFPERFDEVKLQLESGWNTLLIKLGKRGGGFAFQARFVSQKSLLADPRPMIAIEVSPQESGSATTTSTASARGKFNLSLKAGLNNIAIPVKPDDYLDAKSLAKLIDATLVIRLDPDTKTFVPFVPEFYESTNFWIDGGMGVIVNVHQEQEVTFSGTVWDNVSGSPAIIEPTWAFVVLLDDLFPIGRPIPPVTVRNLRTGRTVHFTNHSPINSSDQETQVATFIDQDYQPVVQPGDILEVQSQQKRWRYQITEQNLAAALIQVQLDESHHLPSQTRLLPNYPNPFNPETWIPFQLADDGNVQLNIFEVGGNRVRSIDVGQMLAGSYVDRHRAIYWDGRTDLGEHVSSGIYFVQLMTNNTSETRRMVILK